MGKVRGTLIISYMKLYAHNNFCQILVYVVLLLNLCKKALLKYLKIQSKVGL